MLHNIHFDMPLIVTDPTLIGDTPELMLRDMEHMARRIEARMDETGGAEWMHLDEVARRVDEALQQLVHAVEATR